MRKKLFLIVGMIVGLMVVISGVLSYPFNEKEDLWQMNSDIGLVLTKGIYDLKAYHYQNGNLVDETVIYENMEVASDGMLLFSENDFNNRLFTIKVNQAGEEKTKVYLIHMNQDLDWKGGGLLFGEGMMKEEPIRDQEYPLAFRAAVAGSYQSVYRLILEMMEFTDFEPPFAAVDELVIFTMIKKVD